MHQIYAKSFTLVASRARARMTFYCSASKRLITLGQPCHLLNCNAVFEKRSTQNEKETYMAMLAICMPILAGKKEKWQAMMDQVTNDPNFAASRENAGVHERSFLQETPAGDFVILTFEGDDPEASFANIMQDMPADFADFAKDVHGLDVNAPPPPMPKLVFDSRS